MIFACVSVACLNGFGSAVGNTDSQSLPACVCNYSCTFAPMPEGDKLCRHELPRVGCTYTGDSSVDLTTYGKGKVEWRAMHNCHQTILQKPQNAFRWKAAQKCYFFWFINASWRPKYKCRSFRIGGTTMDIRFLAYRCMCCLHTYVRS